MAQDILWFGIAALGAHLFWQGIRQRAAELALGAALLALGVGAALLRRALESQDLQLATPGLVLVALGTALVAWFTQWTFRPGSNAARVAVLASVVALAVGLEHQLLQSGLGSGHVTHSPVYALARAAVLGWAAVESFGFRRMYQRRAALGLADPVVANRLLLFTVWTSALALMPLFTLALTTAMASETAAWQRMAMVPARILGLVALVGIFLTFLPPRRYTAFILRRAGATNPAEQAQPGVRT